MVDPAPTSYFNKLFTPCQETYTLIVPKFSITNWQSALTIQPFETWPTEGSNCPLAMARKGLKNYKFSMPFPVIPMSWLSKIGCILLKTCTKPYITLDKNLAKIR
jgi:hypothetical protein